MVDEVRFGGAVADLVTNSYSIDVDWRISDLLALYGTSSDLRLRFPLSYLIEWQLKLLDHGAFCELTKPIFASMVKFTLPTKKQNSKRVPHVDELSVVSKCPGICRVIDSVAIRCPRDFAHNKHSDEEDQEDSLTQTEKMPEEENVRVAVRVRPFISFTHFFGSIS
ncbi:hypothetical protein AVEN_115414-1 [Araneus ventricosus]|uniref:Uncharacterized protein n=1 Tax=Araneus ventricosus TaxID=182803 RepID=A0A4Y2A0B9_ARAVE|nr:hypothetical protein AVEN_115414-1 [Araneus ventricosus]